MIEQEPLAESPVVFDWAWTIAAPPEAVWPLVSDTNRMNVLASMAPVRFEDAPNPEGGSDRTGHQKMLGLPVSWDERPFEFAFPTGFSVRRDFHFGVLKAYRSSVLLLPEGTGTRLTHMVELVPRVGLMAPFIRREGVKLQKHWEHAYMAVDAYLRGEGPYPFENVKAPREAGDVTPFTTGADDPQLAQRVFEHVRREHAHELMHLRPFVLADRWRTDREALLGTFMDLTKRGLVGLQWSLLCPHCRGAKGTSATLAGLAEGVHCQACNIQFGKVNDDVVELTFKPDPRVRQAEEASYCVGGPGATPHVCFQSKLMPGAGRDVGLSVTPGPYRVRGPRLKGHLDVHYHGGEAPSVAEGEEPPPLPEVVFGPDGPEPAAVLHLDGPKLRLRVINGTETPQELVIETRTWRDDVVTLTWLKQRPELLEALARAVK